MVVSYMSHTRRWDVATHQWDTPVRHAGETRPYTDMTRLHVVRHRIKMTFHEKWWFLITIICLFVSGSALLYTLHGTILTIVQNILYSSACRISKMCRVSFVTKPRLNRVARRERFKIHSEIGCKRRCHQPLPRALLLNPAGGLMSLPVSHVPTCFSCPYLFLVSSPEALPR